jgi:micrococcal nuclease
MGNKSSRSKHFRARSQEIEQSDIAEISKLADDVSVHSTTADPVHTPLSNPVHPTRKVSYTDSTYSKTAAAQTTARNVIHNDISADDILESIYYENRTPNDANIASNHNKSRRNSTNGGGLHRSNIAVTSNMSLRTALDGLTPEEIREHVHEIAPPAVRSLSLLTIPPDTVPDVPCKDEPINVYIYDVHDGDTVQFLMKCGPKCNHVIKLSLRILGIDTPEIRAGAGRLAEEKIAGKMSRNRLAELISAYIAKEPREKPKRPSLTTIIIRDWDKFGGRVLGEIILPDGKSVTDIMIAEGYGRPYNGEKKAPWTMEDLSRPPFSIM